MMESVIAGTLRVAEPVGDRKRYFIIEGKIDWSEDGKLKISAHWYDSKKDKVYKESITLAIDDGKVVVAAQCQEPIKEPRAELITEEMAHGELLRLLKDRLWKPKYSKIILFLKFFKSKFDPDWKFTVNTNVQLDPDKKEYSFHSIYAHENDKQLSLHEFSKKVLVPLAECIVNDIERSS